MTGDDHDYGVLFYAFFSDGSWQQGAIYPQAPVLDIQPGARRRWGKMDNGPFWVIPTIVHVFFQCIYGGVGGQLWLWPCDITNCNAKQIGRAFFGQQVLPDMFHRSLVLLAA